VTLEQVERLLADFEQDGAGEPGVAPFGKATVRYAATVLRALIERVRTAERERDAAIAALPNWSNAEALQQRDALIAANVAAQAELRGLRAKRDALRPVVEAVAGASVDQTIGSVKVFAVGDAITSRWLPVAAADALRASKEGK
jgi:hypothetical protein